MLSEAVEMYRNPTTAEKNEELEEVEQELSGGKGDVESGRVSPTVQSMNFSVFTQAFTLTFLAGLFDFILFFFELCIQESVLHIYTYKFLLYLPRNN